MLYTFKQEAMTGQSPPSTLVLLSNSYGWLQFPVGTSTINVLLI